MSLRDRAADVPESIKAPATNLTLGSGVVAFFATLAVGFNKTFEAIFGTTASPSLKAAIVIALILAWAVISVADLISRAIAKAAQEKAGSDKAVAAVAAGGSVSIMPLPKAMKVTRTKGADEAEFLASAVRVSPDGSTAFLVAKNGKTAEWIDKADLIFT